MAAIGDGVFEWIKTVVFDGNLVGREAAGIVFVVVFEVGGFEANSERVRNAVEEWGGEDGCFLRGCCHL